MNNKLPQAQWHKIKIYYLTVFVGPKFGYLTLFPGSCQSESKMLAETNFIRILRSSPKLSKCMANSVSYDCSIEGYIFLLAVVQGLSSFFAT